MTIHPATDFWSKSLKIINQIKYFTAFLFLKAARTIFELDHFFLDNSRLFEEIPFSRHPFSLDHSVTLSQSLTPCSNQQVNDFYLFFENLTA